jgi:NAD(P)-dependent dehydrogenase (short-subunit alcohol dehydrogenase family)
MPPSFQNKVILITGAGSGIGRGTSIKMAQLGATLALADINSASLAETLDLCPKADHYTSAFDVGSTETCNSFIAAIISRYGHIDHIFNCAGINGIYQSTVDVTDAYWEMLFNVNVKGFFNITRACIPHLQRGASFVNVTSNFGITPGPGYAVYCATKSAVIGFSKSVALELGPKGIRTNIIAPGAVRTPTNVQVLTGEEGLKKLSKVISLKRIGEPEDIADVVAFLFSEEARYMNGAVVEVTGGFL